MEPVLQSTYERLINKLREEGHIKVMDEAEAFDLQQEISREMEAFNMEKQRKAAASEKDLSEIVLTA